MKRLLPLVLAIASAAAADPVVFEVPRPGGPLRVAVDGGEFEVQGAASRQAVLLPAAADRAGLRRSAAALAAAHPGARIGLVGRLLGAQRHDRVVVTGRVVLAVPEGADRAGWLAARGLRQVEGFAWSARHVVAEPLAGGALAAVEAAAALRTAGAWAEPELQLPFAPLAEPTDPLYATQWHLKNLGTNVTGGVAGNDIGIVAHWLSAGPIRTGAGINVAVVDDGIDLTHPDLVAGLRTDIDSDPAGGDGDPSHDVHGDGHGTVVAGLIGARANGVGGVGVAYGSSLVAVKMFQGSGATQAAVAASLGYRATATSDVIGVSNNSWGPNLGGTAVSAIDSLSLAALTAGVDQGRGGRGTIYVFAGGNSRVVYDDLGFAVGNDSLDYNGYGGNRRVIAVGALKPNGTVASYSEPGVGLLLCAPGGEGPDGAIVSTDWQGVDGFQVGDYTQQDPPDDTNASDAWPNSYVTQGTSFSTPLVSGAVAMLLEANPLLSWRDVPHVLAHSATPIAGTLNGAGLRFHADYGAGRLHVTNALALAAAWTPLPPESSPVIVDAASAALTIPDDGTMVSKDFVVATAADFTVERAELTVDLLHAWRGNIEFRLVAPSGTVATITRRPEDDTDNLIGWTFSSVRTLGEGAVGTWRVEARDLATGFTGTLGACQLTLYGYRPYQVPSLTRIFPSAVLTTQPTTTVSVENSVPATSEGGDLLGTMSLGATVNATVAKDGAGWASVSIPAATFTGLGGPGTYPVSLTNPQVRGVNYALAGGGSATINLTVRATNAVPVLASSTNGTVVAGFATTTGAATFTDPDGDEMRYSLGTAPTKGTATVNLLTGVITYTPTITSMGTDTLTVIATDGMGDSAPVTISYEVERNVSVGLDVTGGSGGSSGGGDGGGGGCGAGAVGLLAGLGVLLGLRRRRR